MLTIKKRGRHTLAIVAAACLFLTACGPPGPRALKKGDRMVQSGKFEEAIEELSLATNYLANDPKPVRARAYNLLGLAYHGAGDPQKARQSYEQALALDRNLAAADYNLGCLELEQTNLPAARDALTTYTTLNPRNTDGFSKLGTAHLHLAMQTSIASERLRQFDNARKAFEAAQRLEVSAESYNNLGLIDLQQKVPPTLAAVSNALTKFNLALKHDPAYAPALLNLAIVYDAYLHDYHSALHAYDQYLSLNPPPPRAREVALLAANLAQSIKFQIQIQGRSADSSALPPGPAPGGMTFIPSKSPPPKPPPAETNPPQPGPGSAPAASQTRTAPLPSAAPVAQAQAPPPNVAMPAAQGGDLGGGQGAAPAENATAEKNVPLTSTAVHKPSKLNPLNWFGAKPKGTPAGAEGSTESPTDAAPNVTPLPPPHPTTHYTPPPVMMYAGNRAEAERLAREGAAAEKQSRLKEAMASYADAIKADPAYYEACVALGMAAIKAEEFGGALEALHHALTLKPESADARYAYAWALEKKNYVQDAANELEKLLGQHPNEIRAHLLLGNLYAQQLGQPDLAREHYKKVLEADPHNPQATAIRFWLEGNPEH